MDIRSSVTQAKQNEKYSVDITAAFGKYSDTVYRLAYIRTKNKADSEDILSDVFLRLVKSVHKICSDEHLKAWLIRATLNSSNTVLRSPYRTRKVDLNQEVLFSKESDFKILPFVLNLSDKLKTVIYMFYYEGYSVEEISKLCSVPVGTVKSRLARARDALKLELKGEFFDV